eukprot:CAMPEP_0175315950 /NCGR_PEP_ID=MMETSP0093-20121207/69165_1 /TAXON_ID=311494 /ORGANISM="Alexandrium monilatum, Strain CCMP3105" /LENGTH=63 /DNA_ID=CAMNT_0016612707 /DNA_START=21 /DNA_END=212 /DNA_ORIENTATION=-
MVTSTLMACATTSVPTVTVSGMSCGDCPACLREVVMAEVRTDADAIAIRWPLAVEVGPSPGLV